MSESDTTATQETRDRLNAITPERTSAADASSESETGGNQEVKTGSETEQEQA